MIQIDDKKQWCGCTACESNCPKKAIKMLPDNEGFLYLHVDKTLCVECGLCEKTCPIIAPIKHNGIPEARIVRNNNSDIVFDSISGGAFSAVAVSLMHEKKAIMSAQILSTGLHSLFLMKSSLWYFTDMLKIPAFQKILV